MLPPTLERYYRKLSSPSRDKIRREGSRTLLRLLFQTMRARFIAKLRTASINPEFNDSVASGQLANSLRLRTDLSKTRYVATVFSSARHYQFIDTGEASPSDKPTRARIRKWIEARFGISAGTDPDTRIPNPGVGGDIAYGDLVDIILLRVLDRIASGFYRGLDLTTVIGKTPERPGGQEVFEDLLDFWVSFYTMDLAA